MKNINFESRLRRVVEEVMSQLVATKETKPPSKAVVMNCVVVLAFIFQMSSGKSEIFLLKNNNISFFL